MRSSFAWGLFPMLCLVFGSRPLHAQNDPGKGWIEGVVVTDKGRPACLSLFSGDNTACMNNRGTVLTLRPKEGTGIATEPDGSKGGFYSLRNLKPGVYEVFVNASLQKDRSEDVKYRPQHIFGIVVEPDKRTVLNVTVHEGESLEEIGKPDVASDKAIILSEELARQRKEIEALKQSVEELKKR
jgi:hypothetical protein